MGVGQEHDTVSDQRGGLVAAAVHGHGPAQTQLSDIVTRNLRQWAMAVTVRRPAPVQPVSRGGCIELLCRDGAKLIRFAHGVSTRIAGQIHDAARAREFNGVRRIGLDILQLGNGRLQPDGIGKSRLADHVLGDGTVLRNR